MERGVLTPLKAGPVRGSRHTAWGSAAPGRALPGAAGRRRRVERSPARRGTGDDIAKAQRASKNPAPAAAVEAVAAGAGDVGAGSGDDGDDHRRMVPRS